MKRKESLKSPVKQKKSRESLDAIASPTPVKTSVEEQRKRAREWADNEARKSAATEESTSSKAKRSATPGKQVAKPSKIVYDSDPEEPIEARPARGRKSIVGTPVVQEVTAVLEKAAGRKVPQKKVQPVEESDEDSEPEPAPVPPRSARKTPAKAKPEVKPVVKTPQTAPKKAAVKAESPKAATPVPAPVRSPVVTPAAVASPVRTATPVVARTRESESAKAAEEEQVVTARPGQSLEPPSGFVVLMVQLYIVIGGVAYRDPQLGFLLFLAVNVLANLFVMSGLNSE